MVRPWNQEYDDSILICFLKEQRKKVVTKHGVPVSVVPVTKSWTELYKMVCNDSGKGKGVSPEVFQRHLNKLVKDGILLKYSKKGKRRQVYRLAPDKYLDIKIDALNLPPGELHRRRLNTEYDITDSS